MVLSIFHLRVYCMVVVATHRYILVIVTVRKTTTSYCCFVRERYQTITYTGTIHSTTAAAVEAGSFHDNFPRIHNRNSGRFKSNMPGNDGETSLNVPVPGIPIIPPNHPSPKIRFILRKNPISTARTTVKILNPSNYVCFDRADHAWAGK